LEKEGMAFSEVSLQKWEKIRKLKSISPAILEDENEVGEAVSGC